MRCRSFWLLALLLALTVAAAPWAENAQRIRQQNTSPQSKSTSQPALLTTKQQLSRKVANVNWTNIPLSQALDYIAGAVSVNFDVNWKALEAMNIGRTTPITVHLRDVPVRKLLKTMLSAASPEDKLTYYIDDEIVEITTRELADQQLILKVYPAADLVMEVPNFVGPNVSLSNAGQTSGGRSGSGGNTSLFSDNNSDSNTQNEQPKTKVQREEDLVGLIKETVKPEIWRDNGGTASIRYFNGHLIVNAPRSVHETLSGGSD
jgi:hypothetical protein